MELRGRSRLNTWASPTMAAKKEWQNAIEGVKKEIMDGMQEYFERMMSKLDEKEQNIKEAMKELVTKEVGEIKKQLGDMNNEIQINSGKIQELETLTINVDKRVEDLTEENKRLETLFEESTEKNKRLEILLEAKTTERQIRLRGLEEEQNEDIIRKIIAILSELLELPPEEIQQTLDLVYRVNSNFAKQNKLPRDIIIQFTTLRKKEEFLRKHYETPLEVDNKKILVLKEILRKALSRRKNYKKLIDFLASKNIRYRWDLPEGLSFAFKGKRQMIKSVDQMEQSDLCQSEPGRGEAGNTAQKQKWKLN